MSENNFLKNNKNIIIALLIVSLFLFSLLVLSPFIPLSPIQYVTKSEKAMIYGNAAISDVNKRDLASAEINLKKAILLDSKNISYQESLGAVLFGQADKKSEAIDVFNKILNRDPKNLTSLYYLGSYAQEKSDYDEAKKKFQAYLDIDPKNPEVLTLLGVVYYKSGNKEGAKEQWQKALEVDPNFEAAKGNLMAAEQEGAQEMNKE